MRVLGLSNPEFHGVTIATKAICTDYCPAVNYPNPNIASNIGKQIAEFKPDLMVVGGWSKGYNVILATASRMRRFPVISIFHGTPFHGQFFGIEDVLDQIQVSFENRHIDARAYVQPQTARYYREILGQPALWIPHYFPQMKKVKRQSSFRIGILGGLKGWHKNGDGPLQVARAFAKNTPNVEIITNDTYDKKHAEFLQLLGTCHLIIHASHLECYSNLVQEAWSRGIPTIISSANVGLYNNPLLEEKDRELLRHWVLHSSVDPYELYEKIETLHSDVFWEGVSHKFHEIHDKISRRAKAYTQDVLKTVVDMYKVGRPNFDLPVFTAPFDNAKSLHI